MIRDCFNWLGQALASSVEWFDAVLESVGAVGIFLAVMFIMLSVRYVLAPILGGFNGAVENRRQFEEMANAKMSAQRRAKTGGGKKRG